MEEKIYWATKNGKHLLVDDMTEAHAKNALKFVLKRIRNMSDSLDVKITEHKRVTVSDLSEDADFHHYMMEDNYVEIEGDYEY